MRRNLFLSLFLILIGFSPIISQTEHDHDHDHSHHAEDASENQNYYKRPLVLDTKYIKAQLDSKKSSVDLPYLSQQVAFHAEEFKFYDGNINPVPGLKTYRLVSVEDNHLQGRMVVGPHGVNLNYIDHGKSYKIFYEHEDGGTSYYEEYGYDYNTSQKIGCSQGLEEGSDKEFIEQKVNLIADTQGLESNMKMQFGNDRRIFRVGLVCTGEYYQRNGGSSSAAKQRMIENIVDISMIFERELNVFLIQASGSPRADYTNGDSDPFEEGGNRVTQSNTEVRRRYNVNQYDVGHTMHSTSSGGSGVAWLAVVCDETRKGGGWSGFAGNTSTQWISLSAHEFGHQFGSPHTFSGDGANCAGNQFPDNNAYEIASGVTLMSYNGICGSEWNISNNTIGDSDDVIYDYFHAGSLEFITNHLNSETARECNRNNWELDANNEPVANANPCDAVYRIPRATPFFIKGEGTDADNDDLTYSWEQYDRASRTTQGNIGNAAASSKTGPLFRCYPPNGNNTRHIPRISDQLSPGAGNDFEVLPRTSRSITMRLVVRDNNPGGTAIDWDDIKISVLNTNFKMLGPTGPGDFALGEDVQVEWEVPSIDDICDKAQIRLSVDGGNSYPVLLKDNVPFSKGFQSVSIPQNIPVGSTIKFQVLCADYECFGFYDTTDGAFTVQAANCNIAESGICDTDFLAVDYRSDELNFGKLGAIGSPTHQYSGGVENVGETMKTTVFNGSRTDCQTLNNNGNAFDIIQITPSKTGRYYFEFSDVNTNTNQLIDVYSIFEKEGFNPSSPCSSFVGSNSVATGSVSYREDHYMRVNLEACKEYYLVSQITMSNAQSIRIKMEGSGDILLAEQEDLNTQLTYIAYDVNLGQITFENSNADFRNLSPGSYHIYSVSYDGVNPSSFIGKRLSDISLGSECAFLSSNYKPIEISSSCAITNLQTSINSGCSSVDNTYSLNVSFGVDLGPTSGTVTINGQDFPLSSGTTNAVLTGLIADGQPLNLNFTFSADDGCQKTLFDVFTAPENCCNIVLELGDQDKCVGESAVLFAGNEGESYEWFLDEERVTESSNTYFADEAGIYTVIVTDAGGCSKSDQTSVSFSTPPNVEITTPDSTGCTGTPIRINSVATNWDSISWLINGFVEPSFENDRNVNAFKTGQYEMQVFKGGCSRSDFVFMDFLESTPFSLGEDVEECAGNPLILDTQEPNLDYTWKKLFTTPGDQPSTSSTLQVTESGSYVAFGTNDLGCTHTDTIRVTYEELDPNDIDLGEDLEDCEGDFFLLRIQTSPVNWYRDGELLGQTGRTLNNLQNGQYVVEQYINDDCFIRDTINVQINENPPVELGPNMSFCTGEEIDTCVVAGQDFVYQYQWALDGNSLGNNRGKQAITETGEYRVIVTDRDTRCWTADRITVEFTDNPTLEILSAPASICDGGSGMIIANSSAAGIAWYLDGELTGFSESTIEISKPGTYRAVVAEGQSCEVSDEIVVDEIELPEIDLPESIDACEGDVLEIDAGNPNYLYNWYNIDNPGIILSFLNVLTVENRGAYIVEADNGICTIMDTVLVNFTESSFVILPDDASFCIGATETIMVNTNASIIKWYNGNQALTETGTSLEITESGTYIAVAQEGQDCESRDSMMVTFISGAMGSIEDVEVCEGEEATFVAGADGEFAYSWFVNGMPFSNSGGTLVLSASDIQGLNAEVSVTIQSIGADCSINATASLSFIPGAQVALESVGPYCEGTPAEITSVGNTNTLTWFRNGVMIDETDTTIEVTSNGTYLAIAGDGECIQRDSVRIRFNEVPEIFIKDQSPCLGESASFVAGADGAYEYQWFFNNNLQATTGGSLTLTTPGDVRVIATGDGGCTTEIEAELEFLTTPQFRIIANQTDDVCLGSEGRVRSAAPGVNAIRWFLNGVELDQTGSDVFVTENGTLVGIAGNGDCEVSDETEIMMLDSPDISISDQSKCQSETATFTAGADGAFIYAWFIDGVLQANTSGSFSVTADDIDDSSAQITVEATFLNDDCSREVTAELEFIDSPTVTINPVADFCDGTPTMITTNTNVSALTWTLNGMPFNQTGSTIEITTAGTYVATAGSGACEARDEITVTASDSPDIEISSQSVCQGEEATFVAGADGEYRYTWYVNDDIIANTAGSLVLTQGDIMGSTAEVRVVALNLNDDCSSESTTTVEFIDAPSLSIIEPDDFCAGTEGVIRTETGNVTTLSWFLDGMPYNQDGLEITVTQGGEYLAVAGTGPCAVRDSVRVQFSDSPEVELVAQSVCQGEEATFVAGADDEFEYSWFINDQPYANSGGTLVLTISDVPASPATVRVVAKNNNDDCSGEAEATVEFISSPTLEILPLESFCKGTVGVIRTNTSNVTALSWFRDGEPLSLDGLEIEIEEDGEYLAVAGSGPCAVRDSVMVTFADSPEIMISDLSKCAGEDAIFEAGDDDRYNYVWILDGVEQINDLGSFTVSSTEVMNNSGMVRVIATNLTDDCSTESEATIEFIDTPELAFADLPDFCKGTPAVIATETNVNSIRWFLDGVEQDETGINLEITQDGEYLAIAGDGECAVRDSVMVTFADSPQIMLDDQSKCEGEDAIFMAGPDGEYIYEWTIDGAIQTVTTGTLSVTADDIVGTSATIGVTASNMTGSNCSTTLEANVEFIATPELTIIDPGVLCNGSEVSLVATTNVSTLTWFLDGVEQDETGIELDITVGGEYIAVAGDGACAIEASVMVTFEDAPEIELASQVKCAGEEAVFVAGPDTYTYVWTIDGVPQTVTEGTLTVTAADLMGNQGEIGVTAMLGNSDCTTALTANVEFIASPELSIDTPESYCAGELGFIETTTNVGTLMWFRDGEPLQNEETVISVSQNGEYLAIAGDGPCAVRDSIVFEFSESPVLTLDGPTEGCGDEILTLTLESDTDAPVVWSRNGMVINGEQELILEVTAEGTYTASVTNDTECTTQAMLEVTYAALATADIPNLPSGVCEGIAFEVEAESDGVSFEWTDVAGTVLGTGITQEFDNSGDYIFIAYNDLDCPTEFPFTLEFRPAPDADLGDDRRSCEGETVELSVPDMQNVTYEWFLDGIPLAEDGSSLTVDTEGTYQLIATNDIDCVSEDMIIVAFIPEPNISADTNVEFCAGSNTALSIDTDASLISWELNGVEIATNVSILEVNEAGDYVVTVSTPENCMSTTTISVEEISIPDISFADIELCPGDDPAGLEIMGDFDTYEWSGAVSGSNSTISIPYTTVSSIQTETVNVLASKGSCTSTASFTVTYYPPVVPTVENDMIDICIGESATLGVGGGSSYSWSDPSGTLSDTDIANPVATPTETTTYEVTIADDCPNNFEVVTITVVVNELPTADAGPDRTTIPDESIILEASGGDSYSWDNTDLIIGSSTVAMPEVAISGATTFTVTVTDSNGCSATDEVNVEIVDDPELVVSVVDAFSPNGDGKNDFLEFSGLELYPENKLTVFNRWGNIVFEMRGYQLNDVRWDGTRNGKPLPAATYYYILEFADFKVKSSVSIIRE